MLYFPGNTAGEGGVIRNAGGMSITSANGHKVLFENNNSTIYGGGVIKNNSASGVIDNIVATFNHNSTVTDGGVIHNANTGYNK